LIASHVLELTLRPVTAVFLHGADNKETEWRTPPLRALARYWLRALMPLAGAKNAGAVRAAEAAVFGSADKTVGQGVVFQSWEVKPPQSQQRWLLPHHPPNGSGPNHPSPSRALVGGEYAVRLRAASPPKLDAAAAALWAGLLFGGIGQRSRRGAGSLEIVSPMDWKGLGAVAGAEDLKIVEKALRRAIERATDGLKNLHASGAGTPLVSAGGEPEYPFLHKEHARIRIAAIENAANEEQARAQLMRLLRNHKAPAFGLPYMKPAPGDSKISGKNVRWASPLHVHIGRLAGGKFYGVFTCMKSRRPDVTAATWGTHGWNRMDDFLASLKGALEVWP
jgi:CRISPR/Cas system CMR-associated protein Cmr1 (group 7 of RAMP superfamily)